MSQISSSEWSTTRDNFSFALKRVTRKAQFNDIGLKFNKSCRLFVYADEDICLYMLPKKYVLFVGNKVGDLKTSNKNR